MFRPVNNLWTTRRRLRLKPVDNSDLLDKTVYAEAYKLQKIL